MTGTGVRHPGLPAAFFTLVVLFGGCALQPATPEQEVAATLMELYHAERSLNIDAMVDVFSPAFNNSEGTDYTQLRGYFQGVVDQGIFGSILVTWDEEAIDVDGNTAVVNPVHFSWSTGAADWSIRLQKNLNGTWKIISSERLRESGTE